MSKFAGIALTVGIVLVALVIYDKWVRAKVNA